MIKKITIMCFCLFGLAALSYFRLWYIGTPNLDDLPMFLPWEITRRTIFFLLMCGASVSFYKLVTKDIDEDKLNTLFLSSLVLQLIASLTLPLTSNDIFANLAFGKMSHLGLNINTLGAGALPLSDPFRQMVSTRWMDMPMMYGSVVGWLNHLITRPDSVWGSIIIYKFVALVFSFIVSLLVYLYCRKNIQGSDRCRSFVLFALNPVFLWELSSQAHNDALMIIGVLGFILFESDQKHWLALICLVFATTTKMAMLPVLGLYFCYTFFTSKKRFALFCVLFAVGGIFFVTQFSDKLRMVLAIPSDGGIPVSRLTSSPLFLIYKFIGPAAYKIYWTCSMAFMAVLGAVFAWRSRTREQLYLYSVLFILLFNLIASPMYQPWYILWVFPFAMALVADKRLRTFIVIFSIISVAQYAILNSTTGSIINLLVLGLFWSIYLRPVNRVSSGS